MKYTSDYFKDNMPEWKRKKDPVLGKLIYRPVSFRLSALCANRGITANQISVWSTLVAICSCALFLPHYKALHILGATLIFVWLLMDCIDGNLARSVRKQPYGDFVDAVSSYVLVAFLGVCLGYAAYCNGGLFFDEHEPVLIVIGAIASTSDTLMRLIYQKFKSSSHELEEAGVIEKVRDVRTEEESVSSLRVRIEMELGLAGIIPIIVLIGTIVNGLDVVLIYMLFYYGGACLVSSLSCIVRAMKLKDVSLSD